MRAFAGVLLLAAVAGCAPASPPPDPRLAALAQAYAGEPTETLWKRQATTEDPRELMMVEAELGARAQLADPSGRYLGSRTAAGVGLVTYPRSAPVTGTRNCADFPSAAAAQRTFLAEGGPAVDPDGLDGDGDGNACGWGAQILTVSNRYQNQPGGAPRGLAALPAASMPFVAETRVPASPASAAREAPAAVAKPTRTAPAVAERGYGAPTGLPAGTEGRMLLLRGEFEGLCRPRPLRLAASRARSGAGERAAPASLSFRRIRRRTSSPGAHGSRAACRPARYGPCS